MSDPVHRAAPESARARGLLTLLSSSVAAGCFVAVLFLHGTIVPLLVALGGIALTMALLLGYGLTTQAAAAPDEENPAVSQSGPGDRAVDPVTTLKQRYAEGELTDTEFEERVDRLLDSDGRSTTNSAQRTELERER